MLHQQRELRNFVAQLTDSFLLGLSLWIAHAIRFSAAEWDFIDVPKIQPFLVFYPFWFFVMLLGPFILDARGLYRQMLLDDVRSFFGRLAQGVFLLLVLMTLLIYLFRMGDLARAVLLLFAGIAFLFVSLRHFVLQRFIDGFFQGKSAMPAVILVGEANETDRFRKLIESQKEVKMTIVGLIHELGNLEKEVAEWLHRAPITAVVFSVPHTAFEEVQKAVNICELEGVEAWVVTNYIQPTLSRPLFEHFHTQPVLVFTARELPGWHLVSKRVLDFTISLCGLLLLFPLMILIAIVIRFESPGPVFFIQERSGQRGRVFRMFKFRSMVSNAAMRQAELETYNEMKGPVFKISQDPRLTRIGGFLRKTSFDELPQLWNVLLGDMSLVGPRPLPVYETQRIMDWAHRRRLSVKPGLTCYWQITGRNQIRNFDEWVRLDLEYVDHWNFWVDLKILVKTVPIVISGWGAK